MTDSVISVVDDDEFGRKAICRLLVALGFHVESWATAEDYLKSHSMWRTSCLVLDVQLSGMSGLELQRELLRSGTPIPIIFITGHGDNPMSVRAMKEGAVEFLTKPFRDQDLLDAIQLALERDRHAREERAKIEELHSRYRSLTSREHEVMTLVVAGLLNKQIAGELGTSEASVKVHRQHVMEKMGAGSLAELVRMADKLGIPTPK